MPTRSISLMLVHSISGGAAQNAAAFDQGQLWGQLNRNYFLSSMLLVICRHYLVDGNATNPSSDKVQ
jgi:hypothetical protein